MLRIEVKEHLLRFKKPAKTSRNTFDERQIFLLHFTELETGKSGRGEAAPLKLLSLDDVPNYKEKLLSYCSQIEEGAQIQDLDLSAFPSIRFGLETALMDLNSEDGIFFRTPFTSGKSSMPINGLVWMNDIAEMTTEALEKAAMGYRCIKFKVGAQDFDEECRMLETIRKRYSAFALELRLDANGAFKTDEAKEQLAELQRFEIHSIEQPVAVNQWDAMAKLCREKIIPIALDEELIGIRPEEKGDNLIQSIGPQYLILKPNLIGGLAVADLWIELCNKNDIGWWATSALESNIGLNAISQWVSQYEPTIPQGLGTGALYTNNFEVPWNLKKGQMSWGK